MKKEKWEVRQEKCFRKTILKAPILWEIQEKYIVLHSDMTVSDEIYLNVFAPTAVAFVEWVIDNAISSGKERLYFLARDCYPMYVAAQEICKRRHIDLDIRLLSVSRYSLRMAEYRLLGEKAADIIFTGGIDVTLSSILKRAGLDVNESLEIAKMLGMEDKLEECLNYNRIMSLKEKLRGNDIFLKYVYEHSCRAYPNVIGYLEQMGMLDETPYALVDSGWIGTLLQTVTNLIKEKKPDFKTEGYYFGLYEIPKGADSKSYHSFYFSPKKELKRKVYFSNSLFETVFSQDCGTTVGYEKKEKAYVPIKTPAGNPNSTQLNRNLELLKEYTEIYLDLTEKMPQSKIKAIWDGGISVCESNLMHFMGKPEKSEVAEYGNNLFCDDVIEGRLMEVARDMTLEEIKNLRLIRKAAIILGIKKAKLCESAWIEGSIVRAGKSVRRSLMHVRVYKYILYTRKR